MNPVVCMAESAALCRSLGVEKLWLSGCLPDPEQAAVAVVGARQASGTAVRLAQDLGGATIQAGAELWSGGALGIDEAAHRGALAAGGRTFAILAGGLDRPYPERNRPLFRQMAEQGGGLVSAFAPGTPFRRAHFPQRNALLSRRARVIIVVFASATSGALSTARAAARFGKRLLVVPGSPGCDQLLREGAEIVTSASDLVPLLSGDAGKHHVSLPEPGSVQASILSALRLHTAQAAESLAKGRGTSLGAVLTSLASLELLGLARMDGDRQYRQTELAHRLLGEQ